MRRPLILAALAMAILATGCGRVTESGSGSGSSPVSPAGPASFEVGPQDTGTTVTLRVGDELVFAPTPPTMSVASLWRVLRYPTGALVPASDLRKGPPFRFLAHRGGEGKLLVTFGSLCGEPGPKVANKTQCPVTASGTEIASRFMPVRLFTITVRVRAHEAAG